MSNIRSLTNVFLVAMTIQGVIAMLQFITGHSIGLHVIGEQYLSSETIGVAKVVFGSVKHIRPYGTFSHPNILGYFTAIAIYLGLNDYISLEGNRRTLRIITLFILALTLLLTFSRISWIVATIFVVGIYLKKFHKTLHIRNFFKENTKPLTYLIVFSTLLVGAVMWYRVNPLNPLTWESLVVRYQLYIHSLKMLLLYPQGVGIGNYSIILTKTYSSLPFWMLQPVHNTFLLAINELGLGLVVLMLAALPYAWKKLQKTTYENKLLITGLLIFMIFDHAFWDIRQAQYLFVLVIGLCISRIEIGRKT
ncbi:MAG: hypothetical protein WC045_03040 [Patescibacteria group bacterium]